MPRIAAAGTWSIVQLEQLLAGRRSALQKLERKRNKVARQLDAIDAQIRELGGPVRGGRNGAAGRVGGGGRVRNAKSLNDTIESVLAKHGKPMRVGDIADAVKATGYRSNSANFRSIVNQTLIKDKRFTAADRGLYQLKAKKEG
jgi:hypothetical protein